MKKLLYFALLSSLSLASCSDEFLERPPMNSVSESTFWKTENDVYLAVNAIYASLPGEGVMYQDGGTDIVHAQYPWESSYGTIATGIVNSTLNAGWDYQDKRKANYFLENVDKAVMNEALRDRYKAEVRFLRAYSYFRMVNNFGDIPLVTKVLGTSESELNIPRTPKAEVINFIIQELTEAAELLPTSYSGSRSNEKGRVTKGAALALKARVLLYEGRYDEAANTAKEVMGLGYELFKVSTESELDAVDNYAQFVDFKSEEEELKFRLALRSYEGLFHQVNERTNKEVILDRQYIEQAQPQYLNTYLMEASVGGWSSLTPTQALVDAYQNFHTGEAVNTISKEVRADRFKNDKTAFVSEFKNRDPRFYATVLFDTAPWNALTKDGGYVFKWAVTGSNVSRTGYNFRKMVDPAANRANLASSSNIVLLRYAEVLLTFAEAKNEVSGPSNEVYDAIDQIRLRAGMPKLDRAKYASKETLREAIRHERMVELALEGQRFMDIRRWDSAKDVMKTIYAVNGDLAQAREWSNKLLLMPIPQGQIDLSGGVLQQNPGY